MNQKGNYRHGAAGENGRQRTTEYNSWRAAKRRVSDPNYERFDIYGGRGITMDPVWFHSFLAFLTYMGPKPTSRHTLDRIDGDGNYEPGNVRWATWDEQAANRDGR